MSSGNASTKISGDIKVDIGDNVTIFDNTHLAGIKVFDAVG